jgi:hypothetical protein
LIKKAQPGAIGMTDALTQLLLNVLLGLYPREWRNRYGGEVRELIQVLSAEQRRSLVGMMPSLIAGATAERLYALRRFDRAVVAAATVATVLALGGSVGIAQRIDTTRDQASASALHQGRTTLVNRAYVARSLGPAGGSSVAVRTPSRVGLGRLTP